MIKASLKKLSIATFVFLVLLLALSPVSSVFAQGLGHAFYGTVKLDGGDATIGTVISAKVDGTQCGSSTVTTPGQYALIVQGDIDQGATIHFYVDGQEADQTFPFQDGWTTELDLTVTASPAPKYDLTITADPDVGGAATDETGGSPYAEGAVVSIKAVPNPGYGFAGWTASAGDFDDATVEETTFTMPAQAVTVTAHFGVTYELAMSADPLAGGDAIDVGAKGAYAAGATVSIRAEPAAGYGFVNWTADPTVTFDDANAEETTFTMPAQAVTVTAHFGVAYNVSMVADPVAGGDAIDVGAKGAYAAGTTVSIRAEPAAGYGFVNWTADPTVAFDDTTAEETTFTMPAQAVTVTAHFEVAYTLAMAVAPSGSGNATDLTNASPYAEGNVVNITATAAPGYRFGNWTATAGEFGNVTATETTFTMPAQNVTVTANFVETLLPQVTTQAATDISSYSGTVHMSYTVGNSSPVEVRFACKRLTDPAWFYTTWASRTTDGTYTEVLTGLVSETEYEFKAQLKYNGTVIEGATSRFTTAKGAGMGLDDLLGYFGCFIATAAYGTPTAEQIDVLREFRDVVLLKSTAGSQLVVLYYQFSPPIADFIAGNDILRTLVRELLVDPIVWIVEASGGMWRK